MHVLERCFQFLIPNILLIFQCFFAWWCLLPLASLPFKTEPFSEILYERVPTFPSLLESPFGMLPLDLVIDPDEGGIPSTGCWVVLLLTSSSFLRTLKASVETHRLKLVAIASSCSCPSSPCLSFWLITGASSATWRRILTIRPRLMRLFSPVVGSTSAMKLPMWSDISLLKRSSGKSGGTGEVEGVILYTRPRWGPVTPAAATWCSGDDDDDNAPPPPACSLLIFRLRFG